MARLKGTGRPSVTTSDQAERRALAKQLGVSPSDPIVDDVLRRASFSDDNGKTGPSSDGETFALRQGQKGADRSEDWRIPGKGLPSLGSPQFSDLEIERVLDRTKIRCNHFGYGLHSADRGRVFP